MEVGRYVVNYWLWYDAPMRYVVYAICLALAYYGYTRLSDDHSAGKKTPLQTIIPGG